MWLDGRFGQGAADRLIALCQKQTYRSIAPLFGWTTQERVRQVYRGLTNGAVKPYIAPRLRRTDVTPARIRPLARRCRTIEAIAAALGTNSGTIKARAKDHSIPLPNGVHGIRRLDVTLGRILALSKQGLGPTRIAARLKTYPMTVYRRCRAAGWAKDRYPWQDSYQRRRRAKLDRLCRRIRQLAGRGLGTVAVARRVERSRSHVSILNRRFNLGLRRYRTHH